MEDEGAGAVVMFSLFEEQIRQAQMGFASNGTFDSDSFAEAQSYFPSTEEYQVGLEAYLDLMQKATSRTDIPILGSLNGISEDGWISYGQMMEEAGASGIELNVFFIPADMGLSGGEIEQNHAFELSHRSEIRLSLLWLSVLYGKPGASLAGTTGVQSAKEVIKYLLAGADA